MEWFESEDFWRDFYPYMFPPERFAAAKETCKVPPTIWKPRGWWLLPSNPALRSVPVPVGVSVGNLGPESSGAVI